MFYIIYHFIIINPNKNILSEKVLNTLTNDI